MKAGMDGAAWDRVASLRVASKIALGELNGKQDEWDDVRTGRFFLATQLGPTAQRDGFDGTRVWSQDDSGRSRIVADDVGAARSRHAGH